jgi:hypothetical protein
MLLFQKIVGVSLIVQISTRKWHPHQSKQLKLQDWWDKPDKARVKNYGAAYV